MDEEEIMRRMNPELFKTSEAHEDGEEEIMRKLNPELFEYSEPHDDEVCLSKDEWDELEGKDGMGPRDIAHKRRDGNFYWWSYYYGDLTELDADDRGANVGLYPENPAQWVQAEFDLFHDTDGEDGQWFANGERDTFITGDPNPATNGF